MHLVRLWCRCQGVQIISLIALNGGWWSNCYSEPECPTVIARRCPRICGDLISFLHFVGRWPAARSGAQAGHSVRSGSFSTARYVLTRFDLSVPGDSFSFVWKFFFYKEDYREKGIKWILPKWSGVEAIEFIT